MREHSKPGENSCLAIFFFLWISTISVMAPYKGLKLSKSPRTSDPNDLLRISDSGRHHGAPGRHDLDFHGAPVKSIGTDDR